MIIVYGVDVGICLDGDVDCVMILDEIGKVVDGDQLMVLMVLNWVIFGCLKGGVLVVIVMFNFGFECYFDGQGLWLECIVVGDCYVVEVMCKGGFNFGGEQLGYIVMIDYVIIGDGLLVGFQFLLVMIESGKKVSELIIVFEIVLQLLKNVCYIVGVMLFEMDQVKVVIWVVELDLVGKGWLLICKFGIEFFICVMVECEDLVLLEQVVDWIVEEVEVVVQCDLFFQNENMIGC